jgi:hypothetical protein
LTSTTYEGFPLKIFIFTGTFAHKHQSGLGVSHTKDKVSAMAMELAPGALTQLSSDFFKR